MVLAEAQVEDPDQPSVRWLMFEGDGYPCVTKRMYQTGVKKSLSYYRLLSLTRYHQDLELLSRGGVVRVTPLLLLGQNLLML